MRSESSPILPEVGWRWDSTYARLPEVFFTPVKPTAVETPHVVQFNHRLAQELGLDFETTDRATLAALFAGNLLPEGSTPIAQAYAGHQFGNLTRLGDGRAILLGEHLTPTQERVDVQLKGAGPTAYSRRGDGRAALGPMLREYLISEAMAALGIPTTRSLAVVSTGEPVFREQPLPGAVLTRVASSHIRVGTFELFAALGQVEALQTLTAYTLARHFPDVADAPNPALALLTGVIERQASLIAHWMRVGFVHGVMNTDNMAISGETIDYGPCAFIDAYDPNTVFSSIDHQGRYAFGNQPRIAGWNLARFAESLMPVLASDPDTALSLAREALAAFPERFEQHRMNAFRAKLGLFTAEPDDRLLIDDLLAWMHPAGADFTRTFRQLSHRGGADRIATTDPLFSVWRGRWHARLSRQPRDANAVERLMLSTNPSVIPRNHVVEAALDAATRDRNLDPFQALLAALNSPFDDAGKPALLQDPPPPGTPPCRTFCGT